MKENICLDLFFFPFPVGISVCSTHRVSVSGVEGVKSGVKHPELPGCSSSVDRF